MQAEADVAAHASQRQAPRVPRKLSDSALSPAVASDPPPKTADPKPEARKKGV